MWVELPNGDHVNLCTAKKLKTELVEGLHALVAEMDANRWEVLGRFENEKDARLAYRRLIDAIRESRTTFRA